MRWLSIVLALIGLTLATPVLAKPSVAVAPIEGDEDDKVGNAIAEALEDGADVKAPGPTGKAMSKLNLSGELTVKDKKALFKKLEVDAIVEGKLEKAGKKKKLSVEVTPKGEKSQKFEVEFKSATSDAFKTDVRDGVMKLLGESGGGGGGAEKDKDKDDDKKDADKDRDKDRDKADKADKDKDRDKDKDDDKDRDKDDDDKEVAEADGGEVKKGRKKSRRGADDDDDDDGDDNDDGDDDDDDTVTRHAVTQVAVRVNAGAGFGRRSLSYAGSGNNVPPRVGTAAASVRFEAELYPLAFDKLGGAAGLGIYGDYDKSLGLGIAVPGGGTAAIDQAHFSVGARYRVAFSNHSLAFGAAYAKRKYVVDRSGAGAMLDVPDVNYSAIAPGAVFRIGAGKKLGIFLGAEALLMLDAGPIAAKEMYGSGSIIAFEADGGLDIALGKSIALRFAVEFAQVTIKFNGKGALANRMVTAAQDRQIGGAATFAVTY